MIELATIAVGYNIDVDLARRDRVANSAFELAEQAARDSLSVGDFGIETIVERGSIDVFVTVVVTAQALLAALAAYGSASEGLDRLRADVKAKTSGKSARLARTSKFAICSERPPRDIGRIQDAIDDRLTPHRRARTMLPS